MEMEFDIVGTNAAIVNAFRRILLAEVPSMAIEKVIVANNTSLFQDEFLAHRLGLIPIKVDPRLFLDAPENIPESGHSTADDSIEFDLTVKCTKNPKPTCEGDIWLNRSVYTSALRWVPLGNQESLFIDPIKPVHDDILLAKLAPREEISVQCVCFKGIGRDHAKFSPVATASYRLLPEIELLREVTDEEARLLRNSFSEGVIELERRSGKAKSKRVAKVANARLDSGSRNVFRHDNLKDAVKMSLIKDHFICKSSLLISVHRFTNRLIDLQFQSNQWAHFRRPHSSRCPLTSSSGSVTTS